MEMEDKVTLVLLVVGLISFQTMKTKPKGSFNLRKPKIFKVKTTSTNT